MDFQSRHCAQAGLFFRRASCLRYLLGLALAGFLLPVTVSASTAHTQSPTTRVAQMAMERWPNGRTTMSGAPTAENCGLGLLLNGMDAAWYDTAEGEYYHYAKRAVDAGMADGASFSSCNAEEKIAMARHLLLLARVTQQAQYLRAARRIANGVDADKTPLAAPFEAEYESVYGKSEDFAALTHQFVPSALQGNQQENGRLLTALVDTLSCYPQKDSGRGTLLTVFRRAAAAAVRMQTARSGSWSTPLTTDRFVYALQKGVRLGYLPQRYTRDVSRAWRNSLKAFPAEALSSPDETGLFLLASSEMDLAPEAGLARGKTVLVDAWFNSQQRRNSAGQKEFFHYKWSDYSDSGYSLLGHIFSSYGASLDTLYAAPTQERLHKTEYYLVVSPDIPAKNPNPHYLQPEDADQVTKWVKQGGILVMMENDPPNAELKHLNLIADRFGIHFNSVLSHHIIGNEFEPGFIQISGGGPVFLKPHTAYIKDSCTLSLRPPAVPVLEDKTGAVIAEARYGKGTVVAAVDPWFYNEYTDHRKIQPEQDNFAAGKEFVRWLLQLAQLNATAARLQSRNR